MFGTFGFLTFSGGRGYKNGTLRENGLMISLAYYKEKILSNPNTIKVSVTSNVMSVQCNQAYLNKCRVPSGHARWSKYI